MAEHRERETDSEAGLFALLPLLWRDPRLNLFCSLFWLPVGWTIASWAPWLGQGGAGVDEVVNVLTLTPPLTTTEAEMAQALDILDEAIGSVGAEKP